MKTCTCGASSADEAKFCSACGKALPEPGPPVCGKCGAENGPGARFCANCGAALAKADAAAAKSSPSPAKASARPKERPKITAARERARQAEPWRPGHVLEPVTTAVRAATLGQAGAIAAGAAAFVSGGAGFLLLQINQGLAVQEIGIAAIFLICAYFMLRGSSLAAAAALGLCGLDIVLNLIGNHGFSNLLQTPGAWIFGLLRWVALPYVLYGGLRGCLAWERLKAKPEEPAES